MLSRFFITVAVDSFDVNVFARALLELAIQHADTLM